MGWLGAAVGGAVGFAFGGPLGAVFGAAVGQGVSSRMGDDAPRLSAGERAEIERQFFTSTFLLLGALAKSDGRVSRAEIDFAEGVMGRMQLDSRTRRQAIDLFNEGKAPTFDPRAAIVDFARLCGNRQALFHSFLELQFGICYVDGAPSGEQRALLERIRDGLGVSRLVFGQMEQLFVFQQRWRERAASGSGGWSGYDAGQRVPPRAPSRSTLASDYRTLGVEAGAGDDEIKRAYRRLMSQHHPDKLVSQGLSDAQMQAAARRSQEINLAYDRICEARGL